MSANDREPGWLALLLQLGKVAGALAAILGVVFLVIPKLQPTVAQPPASRAVTLSDLHVEVQDNRQLGTDSLAIIRFKSQIEGYPETVLPVLWTLINAQTGQAYGACCGLLGAGPPWRGSPTSDLRPSAQRQAFDGMLAVPLPFGGITWKVRVAVEDPSGNRHEAETPPFTLPR